MAPAPVLGHLLIATSSGHIIMASLNDTRDTSGRLIAVNQITGTNVYDDAGEKLGSVEDVMINKINGKIAYAVLSFGGFLGIGDRHYPLPWEALRYDQKLGGYVAHVSKSTLEGAPSYATGQTPSWDDETWGRSVYDHYGATYPAP